MKVLYVCHEALPSPYTNTEQIIKTAAALTDLGVEAHVICPTTSDRDGRPEAITEFYGVPSRYLENGLRIVRCPVPVAIRGNAARPWHDVRAAIFAHASDYDFVYTRDPFSLFAALLAHPRVIFETYRVDLNTRLRYLAWRRFCYPRPSLRGVVTHSYMAEAGFLRAGFDPHRLLVAHNGFEPELMTPRLSKGDARRALGLSQDVRLVTYAGHLDRTKGVDVLLSIARSLPHVHFLLIGHVPGTEQWFTRQMAAAGLDNVSLRERVPPAEIVPYLYAADCLLIPPSADPLRVHQRTVLPLKTFLYLAAGRPILGPDLPDLREVLRHNHDALLVSPDAPDEAAAVLQALLADPDRQQQLAANARNTSGQYTWTARATKIAAFLNARLHEQ
jgi:glycosyltransferase involved in cell wall biosynthesis